MYPTGSNAHIDKAYGRNVCLVLFSIEEKNSITYLEAVIVLTINDIYDKLFNLTKFKILKLNFAFENDEEYMCITIYINANILILCS
jgi:hypothetical protein